MASGGSYPVQDSLNCTVCFERYNSSAHLPKILPCQHTFCAKCINNLVSDIVFTPYLECPVCRSSVSTKEVRTNLAVRDIVEELQSVQPTKLCCPDHAKKECSLFCTDCLQPICALCVKELTKSKHKDHNIDDVEDAKAEMKKSLAAFLGEKIKRLEVTTETEVDKLMQESEQKIAEINAVVSMVTEAVQTWADGQILTAKRRTHQALDKQTEVISSLKSTLATKVNSSTFQEVLDAYKEAEKEKNKKNPATVIKTADTLQQENVILLQDRLTAVFDTVQTSIKDGTLHNKQKDTTLPFVVESDDSDSSPLSKQVFKSSPVLPTQPSRRDSQDLEELGLFDDFFIGEEPERPTCDCFRCIRKARICNPSRNNELLRIVHDHRRGHNELICETDDFVFIADLDHQNHIVFCKYKSEARDDLNRLDRWENIKDSGFEHHEHLVDLAEMWWSTELLAARNNARLWSS